MTETTTREEWTNDDGTHYVEYRNADGHLHRKDGPAYIVTWSDGYQQNAWWEDGNFIRKDEANVASTWKQELDEAVGHLREVVRTYRNADSDGVLAYSDVLGGAIDTAAAWLDAHKGADDA